MSIADAKRAVDIGATAIMVSNHGGRQLDGSRSDRIDVICDGGITRGTVLKALSWARRRVREGGFICMLWRPPVRPALRGHLKISGPKSNAT
jgi:hypothetical protein